MLPDEEQDSAEDAYSQEYLDQIADIVNSMPGQVKKTFLLHRGKGLSYSEIADELNISPEQVEKNLVQALKILREETR